ncbi:hypothetical protein T02_11456 [Trichinella nativa]|uniref:Uncharacterized protein n=1 Tax=Trichinella nativa TaxID=6335 RepID=A0A0V1KTR1_9BILA|nr:hypothetical protein T02_11456 [Trichinella nativa]
MEVGEINHQYSEPITNYVGRLKKGDEKCNFVPAHRLSYVPPGRSGSSSPVPAYSGSSPESRNVLDKDNQYDDELKNAIEKMRLVGMPRYSMYWFTELRGDASRMQWQLTTTVKRCLTEKALAMIDCKKYDL